ncbi:Peptidase S41 [uncultured Paludibacter sp.]|nr:Peptidase S41 [uncultured Paludibacter sp.]
MKKTYFLFIAITVFGFQACMHEPDTEPNTAQGNFDAVWKIIDTRYCYLDYKHINWDSIYLVYSPKIKDVKSRYDLFDLFGNMLNELRDGHVNLYSGFDKSRYWKWYTDYPANFDWGIIKSERYLGDNYRIASALRYNKIADGKVGYVYYESFAENFNNSNMSYIFDIFKDCKGIIIDVRNNGGGLLTNAELMASYFFKEKTLTSYIIHKTGTGHSDFSEPVPIYTEPNTILQWQRKVIILTNRMSYSATNDFICIMQYAPNATIIGDQTGGGGGLPFSSELPNGWMIRFSTSPTLNAEKQQIEWGISPDIKVDMSPADAANGYDTIIETAVKEILK